VWSDPALTEDLEIDFIVIGPTDKKLHRSTGIDKIDSL